MTFKDQLQKLKDNWLLILIVVLVLMFMSGGSNFLSSASNFAQFESLAADYGGGYEKSRNYMPGPGYSEDFAPEVENRIITKTASLSTEVKKGTFKDHESTLRNIISSSDSFLLNENVNQYDSGWRSYYRGYYSIKVDSTKYDAVISQLKEIGDVQSFNENADDITGRYTNVETEIEVEKSRLERYEEMYSEASDVEDKIELSDRIFDQERTIKYLERSLENMDQRVSYSTVSFTMNEKRSDYANITLVKLSQLIRSFVNSFNNLLSLIFVLLPWAVFIGIVWFIVKIMRRR